MAWSAPATPWTSVGEVITSAKVNILADDVRYLKGLAGAVAIEAAVSIAGSLDTSDEIRIYRVTGTGPTALRIKTTDNADSSYVLFNDTANTARAYMRYNNPGSAAAANTLDITCVDGPILLKAGAAGGGVRFFSANDVTSLQTPIAAGTVVSGCAMWLWDRNNTTTVAILGFNGQSFSLGSAPTYVNTDTITVTLTAGGAITVQRTTGTNGSHDINAMVLYY